MTLLDVISRGRTVERVSGIPSTFSLRSCPCQVMDWSSSSMKKNFPDLLQRSGLLLVASFSAPRFSCVSSGLVSEDMTRLLKESMVLQAWPWDRCLAWPWLQFWTWFDALKT